MHDLNEGGLAEAYAEYDKLLGIKIETGDRLVVRRVIAAYLAATAREGDEAKVLVVAWQARTIGGHEFYGADWFAIDQEEFGLFPGRNEYRALVVATPQPSPEADGDAA